jgi:hypothetical protein
MTGVTAKWINAEEISGAAQFQLIPKIATPTAPKKTGVNSMAPVILMSFSRLGVAVYTLNNMNGIY